MDSVVEQTDSLVISGWAITAPEKRPGLVFTCDGEICDEIEYPLPRPDLEKLFPYISYASESGYNCRVRLNSASDSRRDEFVLRCFNRLTGESPGDCDLPSYYRRRRPDDVLPEPNRMLRVAGYLSPESFYLHGYNAFQNFDNALRATVGRGMGEFPKILDWGCGCGRLAIHLRDLKGVELTGVDVDADDIEWCKQHLPFGQFQTIKPRPPMPLSPESFDLVIGVSVFTHVPEQLSFEWLAELRRVAKKGAILLLTFNSNAAIALLGHDLPSRHLRTVLRKGFLDLTSAALGDSLDEANYYRDILHRDFYVKRHWSKFFEILRIVPGGADRFQDLAVLRKR